MNTQSVFTVPQLLCALLIHLSLPVTPATTDLFTVPMVLPFPECRIGGIVW